MPSPILKTGLWWTWEKLVLEFSAEEPFSMRTPIPLKPLLFDVGISY
jgi:hypothetical protein